MAGTTDAIFNGALQSGSLVGLAAITSIETAVEAAHRGSQEYARRAVALWFLLRNSELSLLNSSPYRSFTSHSTNQKWQPTWTHGEAHASCTT